MDHEQISARPSPSPPLLAAALIAAIVTAAALLAGPWLARAGAIAVALLAVLPLTIVGNRRLRRDAFSSTGWLKLAVALGWIVAVMAVILLVLVATLISALHGMRPDPS